MPGTGGGLSLPGPPNAFALQQRRGLGERPIFRTGRTSEVSACPQPQRGAVRRGGWAGAAESTGPTCDHSKSPRLLQPTLEAGGVGVRPSGAEALAGGSLVSSRSSLFRHHPSHSQAPRTGRPPLGVGWGAKSGAASPTGTGQGHRPLRASRRPPGRPHSACVGGHVPFESMGNDLPLAPPTSRARYPHEKGSSG